MGDRVKEYNNLTDSKRRFRYLNFEDRVTTVNSVVQVATLRYSRRAEKIADNSTHFLEQLKNVRNNFDVCDDFVFYFNEVYDKVQSPEMQLHNLSSIVDLTVEHLLIPNTQALGSILELIAVLSTDMRGELVRYYDKLLSALLSLMDTKEPERTSNVFQTLVLMFRNLNGNDIRNNIALIRKYYGPLFGNKAPFIRQFACESYCYLLRHMGSRQYQGNGSAESARRVAKEQAAEQIKELTFILKAVSRKDTISDNMILGVSSLLFESIRGVSGQARQHGLDIYRALLEIVLGKRSLEKGSMTTTSSKISSSSSSSIKTGKQKSSSPSSLPMPSESFLNVMFELQYALSEYILPQKSGVFLKAIFDALKEADCEHAAALIDILHIWMQYRTGKHCEGNPTLFDTCIQLVVEFTGKIKVRDEQLRGALFSLTYALWNYSVKNQSTITVQTRLIQRFVALVQGISVYSDFIFLRIHEYVTFLIESLTTSLAGSVLIKSLIDAIFGMCVHPSTPLNERELVLLCDCVDELPENMRKIAMECGNVEKVLSSLPILLQPSQQPSQQRINAWILHLLNELSPTVFSLSPLLSPSSQSTCLAYCQTFLSQFCHHCAQTQGGSQLSEYTWTDTECVLVAESVRYTMREGEGMRLGWVMEILPAVRLQPTVMLAIAQNMHFIPESERTDKNLLSLLDFYSLVLNHDSHVLREAWLQLFTAFKQPDYLIEENATEVPAYVGETDTFSLLLQAEQQPLSLEGEATRAAIIQRCLTPCFLKLLPLPMVRAVFSYLLGTFTIKWAPLWKQVSSSLEALARIYPALFWDSFSVSLLHVSGYADRRGVLYTANEVAEWKANKKEVNADDQALLGEDESDQAKEMRSELASVRDEEKELRARAETRVMLVNRYGVLDTPRSRQLSQVEKISYSAADGWFVWNSNFSLLASTAPTLMAFNREFITLFLLFIRDHYFAAVTRDDPYIRVYRGNSMISGDYVCLFDCMGSRDSSKRLTVFLTMLKNLGEQVKNTYAHSIIRDLVVHLSMRSESDIQKLCVEILCNHYGLMKDSMINLGGQIGEQDAERMKQERNHLKAYKETLLQMCEETGYRECITTFFLDGDDRVMINNNDRHEMVMMISRILFGRILSRTKVGRLNLNAKRTSIMSYLSTLRETELAEFVSLTTNGFFTTLPLTAPSSPAELSTRVNDLISRNHEISWRRINGLLSLLSDIIRAMAEKLRMYIPVFLTIIAYVLQRIQDALEDAAATASNSDDDDGDNGEEEEDVNDTNNDHNEDGNDTANAVDPTTVVLSVSNLKKMRTLCLRRLIEVVGYFPYIDFTIYNQYFFTPLTGLLEVLPSSSINAVKAPTLIHLANIISCNSYLYYIFDLQPLLVQQTIRCLLNNETNALAEKRTESGHLRFVGGKNMYGCLGHSVVMEIVQFVENLLHIDPENDYFNLKEREKKKLRRNQGGVVKEHEEMMVMQTKAALQQNRNHTSTMEEEKEKEDEEKREKERGLQLLFPLLDDLVMGIQYLLAVLPNVHGNLFNRLLSIVYHIGQLTLEKSFTLSPTALDHLFNLLISFLQYSSTRDDSQDNRVKVLNSVISLVPLVPAYEKGIRELSNLLLPSKKCIHNVVVRRKIIDVFDAMKERMPELKTIVPILRDLHATSTSSIDMYNFAKRGDAYDHLIQTTLMAYQPTHCSFQPLLACVLHDVTDSDMMLRSTAMKCLKAFVFDCAAAIKSTVGAHQNPANATTRMSTDDDDDDNDDNDDVRRASVLQNIMETRVMEMIKYEIQVCNNDNVRRPIMSLLRDIVLLWQFEISLIIKPLHRSLNIHPSQTMCSDLILLTNEAVPDDDILLCLIDIKTRVRSKGLKLLGRLADQIVNGESERITAKTLRTIILPLIFAYIKEYDKNHDAPIREDCAVCIGHLSKLLSWSHYLTLFRKVYGLIEDEKINPTRTGTRFRTESITYNKLYIRILCLIISEFHFDIRGVENWSSVVDERMQLRVEDSMSAKALHQVAMINKRQKQQQQQHAKKNTETQKGKEGMMEIEEADNTSSTNNAHTNNNETKEEEKSGEGMMEIEESAEELAKKEEEHRQSREAADKAVEAELVLEEEAVEKAERVDAAVRPLTERDREKILRLVLLVLIPDLRKAMISEDERKNQTIRSGVAVVICQLLMQLPSKLFEIYLPGLTQTVVLLLKQKMQSDRDEARKTLIQMLNLLGVNKLHLILLQMQRSLTEGNQLFVLSYSVADMVKAVQSSVKLTAEQTISVDDLLNGVSVSIKQATIEQYPLLESIPLIHDILFYDLFEDGARTREVEELRAATKAKYHELAVSRSVETWQTVSSMIPFLPNNAIHLWMAPIFQRIATCEDLQHLNKLRELLKATVLGLMANPSVQSTTLMAYVLTLLQDGEKQLEQEKKEKKEMANEAAVWVTDAITERVTSDGRAQLMVEEAVKLSGTNRNASQRKRVNTNTKEELMGFAIQILMSGLDHKMYDQALEASHQLMDLTIEHILFIVRMCRSVHVIQPTLKLIGVLMVWKLEAFTENVQPLKELLFQLLSDFSATSSDLSRSIFHTLSVLFRQFPKTSLTVEQARALLMLVKRDLNEASKQAAAFELIRVIVARKLMFSELYDLMDELAVMMLQSFSDSTRNQCSRVLLTFTLNYPMSDKRIEKLITFVLKNVDYEEPSGRLANLHFIQNFIKALPVNYLNTVATMFFLPLLIRFTKETDVLCKAVIHETLKKIAMKVDVSIFKQLRSYCDKWIQGGEIKLRRAGFLALLFLIQGRGQVVKGDLPRIISYVLANLPHTVTELKEREVTDEVTERSSETTTAEYNIYSREDGAKLDSIIRDEAVGDEELSENDECTLFNANITSSSRYVDWYILTELLVEMYTRFEEPFHAALQDTLELVDAVSILLLSRHIFARVGAIRFMTCFWDQERRVASLCEEERWLALPGSVFYLLQRLLIMYHLPHTKQSLDMQSALLAEVLCAFSEHAIPAPVGLKNKELRTLEEKEGEGEDMVKRLKDIHSIRSLYSLDDIEEEEEEEEEEMKEEEEMEEEEEEEEEEMKEEEEGQMEVEDDEDHSPASSTKKHPKRVLKTMRRVPNPHRVVDALFVLGGIMSLPDRAIKRAVLSVFTTITAFFTAEQIELNITALLRPLMKMVSSSEEGDAELVEQAMTVIHDNIEGKLDQSTYIRAYSSLQDDMGVKKNLHKMKVKQLKVLNPKVAIDRKRKKAVSAKENKRRKRMIMKGQIRKD